MGRWGEVEASVGPDEACGAAALHARHTQSGMHGQSVREGRNVRLFWTETSFV